MDHPLTPWDLVGLPLDPLGLFRPTPWPPGTLQAYPLTPCDPAGLPLNPLGPWIRIKDQLVDLSRPICPCFLFSGFFVFQQREGRKFRMLQVAIESYYHNRMTAICNVIRTFFLRMLGLFSQFLLRNHERSPKSWNFNPFDLFEEKNQANYYEPAHLGRGDAP